MGIIWYAIIKSVFFFHFISEICNFMKIIISIYYRYYYLYIFYYMYIYIYICIYAYIYLSIYLYSQKNTKHIQSTFKLLKTRIIKQIYYFIELFTFTELLY